MRKIIQLNIIVVIAFFINPFLKFIISAAPETRTLNLLLTRQLRYQLRQNGIIEIRHIRFERMPFGL